MTKELKQQEQQLKCKSILVKTFHIHNSFGEISSNMKESDSMKIGNIVGKFDCRGHPQTRNEMELRSPGSSKKVL